MENDVIKYLLESSQFYQLEDGECIPVNAIIRILKYDETDAYGAVAEISYLSIDEKSSGVIGLNYNNTSVTPKDYEAISYLINVKDYNQVKYMINDFEKVKEMLNE